MAVTSFRWSGPGCTWCGARAPTRADGSPTVSARAARSRRGARCSRRSPFLLGGNLSPRACAIAVFLVMGLVAGLTEVAERALVARLAPVRTGRGFGVLPRTHRVRGAAGRTRLRRDLSESRGRRRRCSASAIGMVVAAGRVAGGHRRDPLRGGPLRYALAALALIGLVAPGASCGSAQVLIRVGEPGRATYSELHEGLSAGSPAADSVRSLLAEKDPPASSGGGCRRRGQRLTAPWNDAPLALTRLAELRIAGIRRQRGPAGGRHRSGESAGPARTGPGRPAGAAPRRATGARPRRARRRGGVEGIARVGSGRPDYGVGDAWVLGRLGRAASDSIQARFLAADDASSRSAISRC